MDNTYLKPITTKENTNTSGDAIAINTDSPGFPYLEYYNKISRVWTPVDNTGSNERMTQISDLTTALMSRDWLVGPRLYLSGNSVFLQTSEASSSTPILGNSTGINLIEITPTYPTMINNDIDLYYSQLTSVRDLLENSSVVDLCSYPTDYRNAINLSFIPKENTVVIRVGVVYVVDGKNKSTEITFSPFTSDLAWRNFSRDIEGYVTAEFMDGVLRLFPEKPEVTECIILHCTANYENLL